MSAVGRREVVHAPALLGGVILQLGNQLLVQLLQGGEELGRQLCGLSLGLLDLLKLGLH